MDKPDFNYYRMVVSTQNDPNILQSELKDLINECIAYINKKPVAKVPCCAGLSAFTDGDKREIDILDARLKRHGFSWHNTDYITMQDIIPKLKALIDSGR